MIDREHTCEAVIDAARRWIGTPYVHQASCLGAGCDCLGLIRGVWRDVYGKEPETPPNYTADWAEAKGHETLCEAASRWMTPVPAEARRPGDVLLFRWRPKLPAKHVAILSHDARFIHACEGISVSEVAFAGWWQRRLAYVFQFPMIEED